MRVSQLTGKLILPRIAPNVIPKLLPNVFEISKKPNLLECRYLEVIQIQFYNGVFYPCRISSTKKALKTLQTADCKEPFFFDLGRYYQLLHIDLEGVASVLNLITGERGLFYYTKNINHVIIDRTFKPVQQTLF